VIAQLGLMLQPQSWAAVTALWVLFAFCGTGGPAGYIAVGQLFPVEQTARVSTAINTLTLAGAFLLQWVIGAMLDLWPRNVIVQLWVSAQAAGWRSPWRRSA
jgi:hypothetical protein